MFVVTHSTRKLSKKYSLRYGKERTTAVPKGQIVIVQQASVPRQVLYSALGSEVPSRVLSPPLPIGKNLTGETALANLFPTFGIFSQYLS